jgi:hypothetical protein
MMNAGDFNAKSTACIMEILVKKNILPVKVAIKVTYANCRNRSFLDIMSARTGKRNGVPTIRKIGRRK